MARNKYDVDEILHIPFNKKHLKRILRYVRPYVKWIILTIVIMIFATILSLIGPYIFQVAIDKVITPNKGPYSVNVPVMMLLAACYLVSQILAAICIKYRIKLTGKVGQHVIRDLRTDIFEKLQKLPFTYYDDRPHGKIIVRVVNYVNTLSDLLSNGIINLVIDMLSMVFVIGFMLIIDARLTLLCVAGIPFLFVGMMAVKKTQRKRNQFFSAKSSNLNAYIHESISGIKVTQSFTREAFNKSIFVRIGEDFRRAWIRAVQINYTIQPMIEIMSISTNCILYYGIASIPYFSNGMKVGVLVAFGAYLGRLWGPIQNMGNVYNQVINAMAYLERIFETIDEPVNIDDEDEATELQDIKGNVKFENVTFGYEESNLILKNLSFEVNCGDTIALVGPTGAGKTTIINLISRFYNLNDGKILIDGNDIRYVKLESLRKQMGIMLQDSFIFSGNIMDNIKYSKPEATDEEAILAAKAVKADEFIVEMENGYFTEVNERGTRLSAGQRQLISFARALLADPRILILDEATASIDTQTEKAVQKGLDKLLLGRTSFIIAHRLSTIRNATKIMYIDNGGIAESGTHDELIRLRGHYYNLYMQQYLAMEA